MSFECSSRANCATSAFFDEAILCAQLPVETIEELGWGMAARVVMNATMDTLVELAPEQLKELNASLPSEDLRCDNCSLGRNDLLRTLLDNTPDSPSEIQ